MVKKVARVPSFCGLTSQEKWHSATVLPLWGLCLGGRQDDPRERHERPAKAEHLSLRDSLQSTRCAFQERGEEPQGTQAELFCFWTTVLSCADIVLCGCLPITALPVRSSTWLFPFYHGTLESQSTMVTFRLLVCSNQTRKNCHVCLPGHLLGLSHSKLLFSILYSWVLRFLDI